MRGSLEPPIGQGDALIVVDMQEDFMPWGALPVPDADKIIDLINRYITAFKDRGALIVATRDWHPPDHISFQERGGPWPPHCVRGTKGAEFVKGLNLPDDTIIVSKATQSEEEAYSGFQGTGLGKELKERGVRRVFICGVATEYCVKNTALDAVKEGFDTYLLTDAIKGVEVNEGDVRRALEEMSENGVKFLTFEEVFQGESEKGVKKA